MYNAPSRGAGNMTVYGYARVSTNGQDLGSQEAELAAAGRAKGFKEKISGAKTDRAELAKALRRLEPGDVLIVSTLDRLPRSTPHPPSTRAPHPRPGARLRRPQGPTGGT